jgi:acetolactate synthase-1/2/3 large subunit
VPVSKLGTDEFQHISVKRVFAGAPKKVIQVSENSDLDIERIVKDGYYFDRSGKPGPVVIDFPFDVQQSEGRYQELPPEMFRHKYENEAHLSSRQCQDFFNLLENSKKPLLYIWWRLEFTWCEWETEGI